MQNSLNCTARLAGAFYLISVITGILHLMYIPSLLIKSGDPAQTLQNIRDSEQLFRWNIAIGIICYLDFIVLVLALYTLLHHVNRRYAQVMVMLVLVSLPSCRLIGVPIIMALTCCKFFGAYGCFPLGIWFTVPGFFPSCWAPF